MNAEEARTLCAMAWQAGYLRGIVEAPVNPYRQERKP